jgi:hypothetical protein
MGDLGMKQMGDAASSEIGDAAAKKAAGSGAFKAMLPKLALAATAAIGVAILVGTVAMVIK